MDLPDASDEPLTEAVVDLVLRGMWRGRPESEHRPLVDAGLAMAKGPVVLPTERAKSLAARVLRVAAGSDEERRITAAYEAFLPVNRKIRDVCTAWQCRPDGTPNDHSDDVYDAGVRESLEDVHEAIQPVLRRLEQVLAGSDRYLPALEDALDRFDDGAPEWLASPLCDSYHTVWMRLHQELLLVLGISRAEDEAREEELVARSRG
ncbi:hypothetical protein ACFXPN_31460 [Streptomyces griseorubiginosus]|uniref:hypothetical protein n=1 Tax=Streptomyces griseorubiginosus TaxID=67304 RepID=UPI002E81258F|nr:hypothetical protein [Streptomyces griseorubiginosus]WUB49718.1 hypothetical protein OHN19_42825 [Streptomyces griseorubiginosus]WUB58247.1 hypothetical protein OG942_42835 [Streptomyces griseorubiginosus]